MLGFTNLFGHFQIWRNGVAFRIYLIYFTNLDIIT